MKKNTVLQQKNLNKEHTNIVYGISIKYECTNTILSKKFKKNISLTLLLQIIYHFIYFQVNYNFINLQINSALKRFNNIYSTHYITIRKCQLKYYNFITRLRYL